MLIAVCIAFQETGQEDADMVNGFMPQRFKT